jgi:hypothetical protein
MRGKPVRTDISAGALREMAGSEKDVRVVRRALAIALVLDGRTRSPPWVKGATERLSEAFSTGSGHF